MFENLFPVSFVKIAPSPTPYHMFGVFYGQSTKVYRVSQKSYSDKWQLYMSRRAMLLTQDAGEDKIKGTSAVFVLCLKTLEILSTTSLSSTLKTKQTPQGHQNLIIVINNGSNKEEEEGESQAKKKEDG